MNRFLGTVRWVLLLVFCCALHNAALFARPVSGDGIADEVASPKSVETANGTKPGLSFPSALPNEMPFRGDVELFSAATRATGSVVMLVGLILIGSFLLKRYWPGRFGAVSGERHIEVLETVALGERQSLTLVQVGKSRLLLARTAASITLLERSECTAEVVEETTPEVPATRVELTPVELTRILTAAAGMWKRISDASKSALARFNSALQARLPRSRNLRRERAPSFEQVMQTELSAATSSAASPTHATRTRLSEIRSRLQAE